MRTFLGKFSVTALAVCSLFGTQMATAQSSADLLQQIKALQQQLKSLQSQVEAQATQTEQAKQAAKQATDAATNANKTAASAAKDVASAKESVASTLDGFRLKFEKGPNSYKPGTVNMYTGEANPNVADSANFMQRIRDDSLSFKMPGGGGFTLYGNLDVSTDLSNNGISKAPDNGIGSNGGIGSGPWGKSSMAAIATNNTYVGLRGFQPIANWGDNQFLWQLQTNMALTSVSGTGMTNSASNNTASGAMTTGTSYVGIGGKDWGAIKVGKTTTPYARSTEVFNPFKGMMGSMNVIMGNTGGDNRVEFDTMMEHAIWYESPTFNNFTFATLFSPGQNRVTDSSAISAGASNCNGGNVPGSGNTLNLEGVAGCNDGGFSNAFSASLVYDNKNDWYGLAAFETHKNVNRSSDLNGVVTTGTGGTPGFTNLSNAQADAMDVATETAFKMGAMYKVPATGTRIGGIVESMKRNVPAALAFQNERQRNGTWLLIQQDLPGSNQINFGWGRARKAVGDPGQHNDGNIAGAPGLSPDNSANMYTLAGIHQVDRNLSFYMNYAVTLNHAAAHYDQGAGGHGYYVDCHDSGGPIPANGGTTGTAGPNCWTGTRIQSLSAGMRYRF
jgi:hypothetical protein